MTDRSQDWLAQAERDVEQARDSRNAGRHEWACFASHQAAEKAIKALHLSLGQEAWGHVVAKLLKELPRRIPVDDTLVDRGHVLDTHGTIDRNSETLYTVGRAVIPKQLSSTAELPCPPERGGHSLCR